jgi:glycosyltransferase involved in cell wall biosynthesis
MYDALLIPVNDLISHPIETRFTFIAKKLMKKFDVNFHVLRYPKIPTSSKVKRKLDFEMVEPKDFGFKNIGLYYAMNTGTIFLALSELLKKEQIDVIIHANILPSTVAVKLGRIFHKPLIYDFQDYFPESASSYFKDGLLKSLTYSLTLQLTKFNIKHSDAVVTVTDAHKEKLQEHSPSKAIKVIPNGVDAETFRPIRKSEALEKLGMSELGEETILIYFGSIDPWLDFSTVFKVMKRLLQQGHDVTLFIIGFCHSKYYLDELKSTVNDIGIKEHVCFFDPVFQDELVYYINASDVTLVPYKPTLKNQAVPLKILESLACNKFVCATKLPEIVSRFKGVVTTYSSEEELENALLKFIKEEVEMPKDKTSEILKEYSWDNIASSYYNLITEVINSNRK